MDEFLQTLEKMKEMQIVRFFSQFFTEEKLSPVVTDFKEMLEGRTPGSLAGELFTWAIVLAVGAFLIDQAFYWTRPGQIDQARETWYSMKSGAISIWQGVKTLLLHIRDGGGRKELPRGRR